MSAQSERAGLQTPLEWALKYASRGWRVLPLHTIRNGACSCGKDCGRHAGKHPLVRNGVKDATRDEVTIKQWFAKWPDANVGIATGRVSGLVVVDIDGPEGEKLLADFNAEFGPLPEDLSATTGKGRHLYFAYPPDAQSIKNIGNGKLDLRGDGGYVVAPPSRHASGRVYAWKHAKTLHEITTKLTEDLRNFVNQRSKVGAEEKARGKHVAKGARQKPAPRIEMPEHLIWLNELTDPKFNASSGISHSDPPRTPATIEWLRGLLKFNPVDLYDDWRNMGFALEDLAAHSPGRAWEEPARKLFDERAKETTRDNYNPASQAKLWENAGRYDGDKVTLASLIARAKNNGWKDDRTAIEAEWRAQHGDGQERRQEAQGQASASGNGHVKSLTAPLQTDLGNARRLVARHGAGIRFVHAWGKWVIWDGERWRVDDDGGIMRLAKDTIEAIFVEAANLSDGEKRDLRKHALKSQSVDRLRAMVKLAESELAVVLPADAFDANPLLLGVSNGVIDLRSGSFRPATREDYIVKRAGVAFDPKAQCPSWRKFLGDITDGDRELIAYLQRVVGYALTGLVREEVMFVLWGTGRNGKSTFRETLHALMGDYAIGSDAGLLVARRDAGGASPDVARLQGRRFVAINETSENDRLNESRVKFLTSNDKLTARKLYHEPCDFTPTHKTFMATNHKPLVQGADEGLWRRIHLLPFIVTIPVESVEKDFRERRLIPELPGILNWALEGLAAYLKDGLNPPACVVAATDEYRKDMDLIGQWIEERCDRDAHACTPTSALHADYEQWASGEIGWSISTLKFGRNLADRGFKGRKGTGGRRMVIGLKLKAVAGSNLVSLSERRAERR
jgi:putative DNA primase/helicase